MAHPFVDQYGVTRDPPSPLRTYERGPWPRVRNWMAVAMVALLAFAWFARGRVEAAEEARLRRLFWVEYSDSWSNWFDQYGVPTYDEVLAGGAVDGERLTATSGTYQGSLLGSPAPNPADMVRRDIAFRRHLNSPRQQTVLDMVQEWDLGIVAVLSSDGTRVVDPEGLAELDASRFVERLRAAEEASLPGMRSDLDRAVLVHRLWLVLMYACMVLVALMPFGMIAARRIGERAAANDLVRYVRESDDFAAARRAASVE